VSRRDFLGTLSIFHIYSGLLTVTLSVTNHSM